jgi:2-polyprenyl-6-methoxyphenol hydroxylase-like FAD-dependent oxidoreductase
MAHATPLTDTTTQANQQTADIVIIGAGVSGSLAAVVLGRAGYHVTLVDRYAVYPPDFRAEHLDGAQIDQFNRLGLLADLTAGVYRGETVACGRRGKLIEIHPTINFGLRYEQLVNTARGMLPDSITSVIGKVVDVEASNTIQRVHLADGRVLTGRLLIVAAGLGYALCRRLGITRRIIRNAHSLTFGFNMHPTERPAFEHSYVVYQGEKIADRIDYLAIFRLGETTRANLFTFRDHREPWTAALRENPNAVLHRTLPGLTKVIGEYDVSGKVELRTMDLYVSEGHVRDGVVLIGDAFQTACPAAGTGLTKVLTDIERLCYVHIPQWLSSEGMGRNKIAAFYSDPVKRAADAKSIHDAEYRRSVTIEPGLRWSVHRTQVHARRLVRVWGRQRLQSVKAVRQGDSGKPPSANGPLSMRLLEPSRPDPVV